MKYIVLSCLLFFASQMFAQQSAHFGAPKFVPLEGQRLLIIGQDLGAIGGLTNYSDGYIDNLGHVPAGITTYAGIPDLNGLLYKTNWGAGDVHAAAYRNNDQFENSVMAIGLHIVGQLFGIKRGYYDADLKTLATFIKEEKRPVFLRIGYEFDGSWNGYDPEDFIEAWRYIVHYFDQLEVKNVAYVWQSAGINTANIDRWYPGDSYVNWVGYSHFDGPNPGQSIQAFAKEHDKPIMIAEATPRRDLKSGTGQSHWDAWFAPLFASIHSNEQIKALAYINADWDSQSMWQGQGWGDSRVEVSQVIQSNWMSEIEDNGWLLASEELFTTLNYQLWLDSSVVLSARPEELSFIKITRSGQELSIGISSEESMEKLEIYNLSGELLTQRRGSTDQWILPVDWASQALIIRVKTTNNWITQKILNIK